MHMNVNFVPSEFHALDRISVSLIRFQLILRDTATFPKGTLVMLGVEFLCDSK